MSTTAGRRDLRGKAAGSLWKMTLARVWKPRPSQRGGITTTDATLLDLSKRPRIILSVRPKVIKGGMAIGRPIPRVFPSGSSSRRLPLSPTQETRRLLAFHFPEFRSPNQAIERPIMTATPVRPADNGPIEPSATARQATWPSSPEQIRWTPCLDTRIASPDSPA
jgi:hypothetical protein